jgi:hypothetical protein
VKVQNQELSDGNRFDSQAFHLHQRQQESVAIGQQAGEEEEAVDDGKEKRIRDRNALYSRRKYYKKKIEVEVTQDEAHRLQTQKSDLLQEQKRLEQLYTRAQQTIRMYESNVMAVAVAHQQDQQARRLHDAAILLASTHAAAAQRHHSHVPTTQAAAAAAAFAQYHYSHAPTRQAAATATAANPTASPPSLSELLAFLAARAAAHPPRRDNNNYS